MLLYFKTANNLSFDEEVEFSMVAGNYTELPESTVYLEKQKVSVVKSAAIFGANASGKTNLIKCLELGIEFITRDFYSYHPNLNKQVNKEKPTTYVYGFLINGVQFEYSFSLEKERVMEEKLIEYKTQKPTVHYYRKYNLEKKTYDWSEFSKALKSNRRVLNEMKKILPEKSLLLNKLAQFEISLIKQTFDFFEKVSILDEYTLSTHNKTIYEDLFKALYDGDNLKAEMMNRLKKADFMLDHFEVIKKNDGLNVSYNLATYHKSKAKDGTIINEKYDFFQNESTGTQKYLLALALLSSLTQKGALIVIDELDSSLHTHLLQQLVSMIHDSEINKKNAQLIFTTHDTNLLNQDLLRRDQIWFAERDELGNSKLIPLSDFKVKKGINLENSYLQGVYGGIPNLVK